eukprot:m.1035250 g.1035250  ORF g.1035250 m.1035250 type:complete len:108 (+) comp24136_c1_seq36:407-730(+)
MRASYGADRIAPLVDPLVCDPLASLHHWTTCVQCELIAPSRLLWAQVVPRHRIVLVRGYSQSVTDDKSRTAVAHFRHERSPCIYVYFCTMLIDLHEKATPNVYTMSH